MPYLAGFDITNPSSTGTTFAVPVPPHAAGDLLVCVQNCDAAVLANVPTSSGGGTWTSLQTTNAAAQTSRLSVLECTSSAETCDYTLPASETSCGFVAVIKSNGGTIAVDGSAVRNVDDSSEPHEGVGLTTTVDNCLVLHFLTTDGGLGPICRPPFRNLVGFDTGSNSIGAALAYQEAAGAVPVPDWSSGVGVDGTAALVIALSDDGTEDSVTAYLDPSGTTATHIATGSSTAKGFISSYPTSLSRTMSGQRDFTGAWNYNSVGPTWSDRVAAFAGTTLGTTLANAVDSAIYWGYDYQFETAMMNRSIAAVLGTGNTVWEYSLGGGNWSSSNMTTFPSVTVGGVAKAQFSPGARPWPSDWAPDTVNGVTKYWVRLRCTASGFTTAPQFAQCLAGGSAMVFDSIGAAADSNINPYANSWSLTPAQSTVLNISGFQANFSSTLDLSSGLILIHHRAALSRDYQVDPCIAQQTHPVEQLRERNGVILFFETTGGIYEGFTIHSRSALTNSPNDFNVAVIQFGNGGASPSYRNRTMLRDSVGRFYATAQAEFGPMVVYLCNLLHVVSVRVAGGGVGGLNPVGFDELNDTVVKGLGYSLGLKQSGDSTTCYVPLQLGGGGHCNVSMDSKTFLWPNRYDGITEYQYNGQDDGLGIEFYGTGSNDRFTFTNCTFRAGQPQYWRFNASHSASSVLNFSGSEVIGMNVTLRSTATLTQMAFTDCPSLLQNGATLTDCDFFDTTVTADDVEAITGCRFNSSGTGHAVDLGTVAATTAITWENEATGYAGTNGSTGNETILVNVAASQTLTINVASGATTPSVYNTGPGTVNVVAGQVTTTIKVIDVTTGANIQNARVYLVTAAGGPLSPGTLIFNDLTDVNGEVEDIRSVASPQPVTGWVRKSTSAPFYKTSPITGTISNVNGLSLTVQMILDQ